MKLPVKNLHLLLRRIAIAGLYVAGGLLTLGILSYGLAWENYPVLDRNQDVRGKGGFHGEGRVVALSGIGIGIYKDYVMKLDAFPREISIPAVIASPILLKDGKPAVSIADRIRVGDRVRVHTVGGEPPLRPVIIELSRINNGILQEVLNWDTSSRRFEAMEVTAPQVGRKIRGWAVYPLPLVLALHLLIFIVGKSRRHRQLTSKA